MMSWKCIESCWRLHVATRMLGNMKEADTRPSNP